MNHEAPFNRRDLFICAAITVLLVLISGALGAYIISDPGIRAAYNLIVAAQVVDHFWVEPVDSDGLIRTARDSMFARLDRYSGYVDRSEFDQMREEMSGGYGGIGITIVPHDDGLLIMSVREGSPAARAGLLSGDVILGADSVSFDRFSIDQAGLLLRGDPGSTVNISLYRTITGDTIDVPITRERVELVHVPFAGYTDRGVMYIRVLDFDAGAADEVRNAVDSLLSVPDVEPAGVILDLRGNPGGLFTEAYRTAAIFLESGRFIVGTDGRSRWNEETHSANYRDLTNGLPMAVIVNHGSASSAEIVAGSLQQAGRAILVGDTTFGKGLVQGFIGYPDGDGIRLTISRYYFENNVYLNRFDSTLVDSGNGLAPDHYYRYPELDPYVRTLENSLLMQDFVYRNLAAVLAESDLTRFGPILSAFAHHLAVNKFRYSTPTTDAAAELASTARTEDASPAIRRLADRVLRQAEDEDTRLLFVHAGHIAMRLREIAIEREYGVARSYRDVILPNRGDIKLAEELLLNRRS